MSGRAPVLLLLLFSMLPARAAVDLTLELWNGTLNAPATVEELNVLTMGREVRYVAAEEQVAGRITVPSLELDQPYLIQAVYGGLKYSRMLMPGQSLEGPLRVSVYEATSELAGVHAHELRLLFGHDNAIEHFLLSATLVNHTSYTVFSEGPTLFFPVPEEAVEELRVSLSRGSIPVDLLPERQEDGRWGVRFDLQPGTSSLQVSYNGKPYAGRSELALDFPFEANRVMLLTLPPDISVSAPALKDLGVDPEDHVHVYEIGAELPGALRFLFEGGKFDERAMTPVHAGRPVKAHNYWRGVPGFLLGGGLLLVLLAFALSELYRRSEPGGALNLSPAEHAALLERLRRQLAELEARHQRRELSEAAFRDQSRRIRAQLALLSSQPAAPEKGLEQGR